MTTILNPTITLLQTKFKKSPHKTLSIRFHTPKNQNGAPVHLYGRSILSPDYHLKTRCRIQNTAQGLHSLRHMLETMSWRYVIFYIRLKLAYLRQDMKSAMVIVPEARKNDCVNATNELVDNMG
ncbi:Photosynthetic NDH subunit of lumenal location 2 chloroplastic [Bienertia sinuspersici]